MLLNLIFEVVLDVLLVYGGSLPLGCSSCHLLTGISWSCAAIPSFLADVLLNSQRYLLDTSQINTISAHDQLVSSAQPASSAVLLFQRHRSIFHGSSEASSNLNLVYFHTLSQSQLTPTFSAWNSSSFQTTFYPYFEHSSHFSLALHTLDNSCFSWHFPSSTSIVEVGYPQRSH